MSQLKFCKISTEYIAQDTDSDKQVDSRNKACCKPEIICHGNYVGSRREIQFSFGVPSKSVSVWKARRGPYESCDLPHA
jgi:hypothetical protein